MIIGGQLDGGPLWWEIRCFVVDGQGRPIEAPTTEAPPSANPPSDGAARRPQGAAASASLRASGVSGIGRASEGGGGDYEGGASGTHRASCGAAGGLQAVVVLEKVQTGILGATLSSFGITGMCDGSHGIQGGPVGIRGSFSLSSSACQIRCCCS